MNRVVRKVPADWCHEEYSDQPLFDGFRESLADWNLGKDNWEKGLYYVGCGKFEQTPEQTEAIA